MLLQSIDPASSAWPKDLVDQVCTTLGVDPAQDTPLGLFLQAIDDASNVLKVAGGQAPNWTDETAWVLNRTIESTAEGQIPLPTNALWCETTEDAYILTTTVSFDLSQAAASIVEKAHNFIIANFDGLNPSQLTTLPPSLTIGLTRVSRYGLDNASAAIDDSKVTRSRALTFAFKILNFNIYIDLTETDRKLVLTPSTDEGIASLIKGTFSDAVAKKYLDLSLFPDGSSSDPSHPDTNQSNVFSQLFDHFYL